MTKFPQINSEETEVIHVKMNTNKGSFVIELYPEYAPKTVENFLGHAENNYYEGTIFHRIIKGFMIQGGDPTGTGMGGESIWGEAFEDEFTPALYNFRGALSMANSGPNTNGSQFFIVTAEDLPANMIEQMEGSGYPDEIITKYKKLGGTPWLDQRHTVFGYIVEGMEVVEAIEAVKTDPADKPVEDVKIESIEGLD